MKFSLWRGFGPGLLAILCLPGFLQAQTFSHADSGWVPIFNGKDWTGIYSRNWGTNQNKQHPPGAPYQLQFLGTDSAVMRVSATSPGGNIGTDDTTFSHYRMRVEQKFDILGGDLNGGLTYHTDENPNLSRMSNNWPRSIEFQMQQREPGSAYSIQQLTFTTRVSGNRYAPTGGNVVQACENGCDGRSYISNPTIKEAGADGKPRWLRFELVVRGADTAYHIINDTLVFKLWNMRVFNDNANKTPNGPVDHGGLGLQSEGAVINYRRWEVMKFPAGTPMNENYLHRFFLDNPKAGVTLTPGATHAIQWRSLGKIPTVNIDYKIGAGAWQSVVKNQNNAGSYDWTVPNTPTENLRVRITGPDWAGADSSTGDNTIATGTPLSAPRAEWGSISLTIQNHGLSLEPVQGYRQAAIVALSGRQIKSIPIRGNRLDWDRRDDSGNLVQPGIYFVRLSGPGVTKTWKALLN